MVFRAVVQIKKCLLFSSFDEVNLACLGAHDFKISHFFLFLSMKMGRMSKVCGVFLALILWKKKKS